MKTLSTTEVITVPAEVAVCPYCNGKLIARPGAWTEDDDGSWMAVETGMECDTEPDPEEDVQAWEDWHARHSVMPYVEWLPVDMKVLDWINGQFRFASKTVNYEVAQDHVDGA